MVFYGFSVVFFIFCCLCRLFETANNQLILFIVWLILMFIRRFANYWYFALLQGQNESKKRSRSVGPTSQTKGTAMSFGFNKKKLPTQKRHDGVGSKDSSKNDLNVINANILKTNNACCIGDSNGNSS